MKDSNKVCLNIDSKIYHTFISKNNEILYYIKHRIQYVEEEQKNNMKLNEQNAQSKHFIIIRFYCDNMMEKKKLFNQNLLNDAVEVFKKFTLKSLEN